MDPVWTLFRRRALTRLRYWLTPLGYDLADRSISNRIYLVYFCIFWLIWVLVVFSWLGSSLAAVFNLIQVNAAGTVVALGEYALIAWGLVMLCQVSMRSPFVFSDEDAYLLCQAPVSRRRVALAWFLDGVAATLLLAAAASIVLAFALTELRLEGQMAVTIILAYLAAGGRAVIVVLPLAAGWQAAWWGLGAMRLHAGRRSRWRYMLIAAAAAILLLACLFTAPYRLAVSPFYLPVGAAFMQGLAPGAWWSGLFISLLILAAGLLFLLAQSRGMSLDRAARETRESAALSDARRYNQLDLVDAILLRRRLGVSRAPSRLLSNAGTYLLPRKDLLQWLRGFRLRDLAAFLLLCGMSLGMFLSSRWELQMVAAGVWALNAGAVGTRRLRGDMARWWLFRSLPLPAARLLRDEMLFGSVLGTLAGWLGLALTRPAPVFALYAALLFPLLAASAAMAAASDILRQSHGGTLMSPSLGEENVPRPGFWGLVQELVSVLVPFGILAWSAVTPLGAFLGALSLLAGALIVWLNRKSMLTAYRWME